MGVGYKKSSHHDAVQSSPYYWKLKKAIMLGKADEEIALAYYAAYNYLLTEEEDAGITSMSVRKQNVRSRLEQVIKAMNPLYISHEKKGREESKKKEFLNYLSDENRTMAENLEKTYKFRYRQFKKILRNPKYNRSIYPY